MPDLIDLANGIEEWFSLKGGAAVLSAAAARESGVGLQDCTLGQVADCVWEQMQGKSLHIWPWRAAWERVRVALSGLSGVSPREVRRETSLAALLPKRRRRTAWRKLGADLGIPLPALVSSRKAMRFIATWTVGVAAASIIAWLALARQLGWNSSDAPAGPLGSLAALAGVSGAALVGMYIGHRLAAQHCPWSGAKAELLTRMLLQKSYKPIGKRLWTAGAVWSQLCAMVSHQTGRNRRRLRKSLRFIGPLGYTVPRCNNCRYDLRATWPECPECGSISRRQRGN